MFGFGKKLRKNKDDEMAKIANSYLKSKLGIEDPEPYRQSSQELAAEEMRDWRRFMFSNHPTVPTIDNGKD